MDAFHIRSYVPIIQLSLSYERDGIVIHTDERHSGLGAANGLGIVYPMYIRVDMRRSISAEKIKFSYGCWDA